jgi:hypothetical protein
MQETPAKAIRPNEQAEERAARKVEKSRKKCDGLS